MPTGIGVTTQLLNHVAQLVNVNLASPDISFTRFKHPHLLRCDPTVRLPALPPGLGVPRVGVVPARPILEARVLDALYFDAGAVSSDFGVIALSDKRCLIRRVDLSAEVVLVEDHWLSLKPYRSEE